MLFGKMNAAEAKTMSCTMYGGTNVIIVLEQNNESRLSSYHLGERDAQYLGDGSVSLVSVSFKVAEVPQGWTVAIIKLHSKDRESEAHAICTDL